MTFDNRLVDLVSDGYDIGVRLEESLPPDMVKVALSGPFRFIVVAAPSYLERHGAPRRFEELRQHACIGLRMPTRETTYRWELERRGRLVRLDVPHRLVVEGMSFASAAARAGLGLAYVDEPSVADDLAQGTLRVVLPRLAAHVPGLFVYYPQISRRTPRVQAFVRVRG